MPMLSLFGGHIFCFAADGYMSDRRHTVTFCRTIYISKFCWMCRANCWCYENLIISWVCKLCETGIAHAGCGTLYQHCFRSVFFWDMVPFDRVICAWCFKMTCGSSRVEMSNEVIPHWTLWPFQNIRHQSPSTLYLKNGDLSCTAVNALKLTLW